MAALVRNRRAEAAKLADALNSIEGVPVSDYAKELSQSWVNGELTGEQMKTALLAFHKKIAERESQPDIGGLSFLNPGSRHPQANTILRLDVDATG